MRIFGRKNGSPLMLSTPPATTTSQRPSAIDSAASWIDSQAESYANVAQIAYDAITAYSEDVRAGRQVKGGIPAP